MFGFSDRPAKAEPKSLIGGDMPAKVYSIGRHEVTVYDNGEVTHRVPSSNYGDPRRALPNMEIVDGQIRIALEDLIDEILARISAEELAVALWANDEVKDRFMEALADRWSDSNVGDDDRRKFLDKVKEQVHDKALDKLAEAMAKMEYGLSTAFSCWREISNANDVLANLDVCLADGTPLRLKDHSHYGEFSIGGASWNEAREHWRHEVRVEMGWM